MHHSMPRSLPIYSSIQMRENKNFWHLTIGYLVLANITLIVQLVLRETETILNLDMWYFMPVHIGFFIITMCCNTLFGAVKCGQHIEPLVPLIELKRPVTYVVPVEYYAIVTLQFLVCLLAQPILQDGFDLIVVLCMMGVEMLNLYIIIQTLCC